MILFLTFGCVISVLTAGKQTILVVMHHTFKSDHVVAETRRQITNRDVQLTVDCLFYEQHFLKCKHNDKAWCKIQECLGISGSQVIIYWSDIIRFTHNQCAVPRYSYIVKWLCCFWHHVVVNVDFFIFVFCLFLAGLQWAQIHEFHQAL